jgi:UDP:flavonoid glycosyltransferase YjiC (YdhE family)
VGSKPIRRTNLTAQKLSDAIKFVSANEIKNAAIDLGRNIESENGAETATKIIINYLDQARAETGAN